VSTINLVHPYFDARDIRFHVPRVSDPRLGRRAEIVHIRPRLDAPVQIRDHVLASISFAMARLSA
jgi:hypothetical protein